MKVPEDKYPYLARYQRMNPNGYEATIADLRKLAREPESKEEEYWGQIESDLWHLSAGPNDLYEQMKKKAERKARFDKASKAFVEGLNRQVVKEHGIGQSIKESLSPQELQKKAERKREADMAGDAFVEGLNRQTMKEQAEEKDNIQGKLTNQPSRRERALKVLEKAKEKYRRLYLQKKPSTKQNDKL